MSDTRNGTLVAATVKTETLDGDYDYVDVLCIGSSAIYWTLDGSAPTVGGDGCYVSAPNGSLRVPVEGGEDTTVKMISAGTPDYSVSPDPGLERSGAGLATTSVAGAVEIANDAGSPIPVNGADGSLVAVGSTTDAATEGDTNGSLLAKLRGLAKNVGKTDDAAVATDANGTLKAHIRGLVKILADVYDSANHRLKVQTLAFTTAGTATSSTDNTVTNASEVVLPANADRKAAIFQVVSGGALRLRLDGTNATTTNGIRLAAGDAPLVIEAPYCPTGDIKAIRESGVDGVLHVTEIAATT